MECFQVTKGRCLNLSHNFSYGSLPGLSGLSYHIFWARVLLQQGGGGRQKRASSWLWKSPRALGKRGKKHLFAATAGQTNIIVLYHGCGGKRSLGLSFKTCRQKGNIPHQHWGKYCSCQLSNTLCLRKNEKSKGEKQLIQDSVHIVDLLCFASPSSP